MEGSCWYTQDKCEKCNGNLATDSRRIWCPDCAEKASLELQRISEDLLTLKESGEKLKLLLNIDEDDIREAIRQIRQDG